MAITEGYVGIPEGCEGLKELVADGLNPHDVNQALSDSPNDDTSIARLGALDADSLSVIQVEMAAKDCKKCDAEGKNCALGGLSIRQVAANK